MYFNTRPINRIGCRDPIPSWRPTAVGRHARNRRPRTSRWCVRYPRPPKKRERAVPTRRHTSDHTRAGLTLTLPRRSRLILARASSTASVAATRFRHGVRRPSDDTREIDGRTPLPSFRIPPPFSLLPRRNDFTLRHCAFTILDFGTRFVNRIGCRDPTPSWRPTAVHHHQHHVRPTGNMHSHALRPKQRNNACLLDAYVTAEAINDEDFFCTLTRSQPLLQ